MKAEEEALKRWPNTDFSNVEDSPKLVEYLVEWNMTKEGLRKAFIAGVNWQINETCKWLVNNLHRYDESIGWTKEEFINNFKKAMEAKK